MSGTTAPAGSYRLPFGGRASRRLWTFLSQPERILGIVLALILGGLVLVPLFELVRETVTVQPYDRAYLPKAQVGDFTLFHYERVFAGRLSWAIFYKPFFNSLVTALGATIICLTIGCSLAWLVVRTNIPFRNTLHTLVMIPYMLPSWVLALAWITFFKNDRIGGAMGAFAYFFGTQPPDWIAYGPIPIVICLSLHYYVYSYLSVSSSLVSVDSQLEEAGAMSGLSRLKQILLITAPLLLPAIGSAVVMTFIRVIGSFGTPAVLGMPVRYYVLPTQIYAAMGTRNAGDGFLLALVLVLLACLFIYVNQRMIGVRKSFVTLSGKGFRNKEIDLGFWRWPIFALLMVLMVAAVAFPLVLLVLQSLIKTAGNYSLSNLTLHYWIGGGGEGVDQLQPALVNNGNVLDATWNSLKLSFMTAMTTGIFGFLIGYVVVRTRGTLTSKSLEMVAFLPYIFPALAFGAIYIGMFSHPVGPFPALYGTFALLVLICSVKTLPFTARTGIAALLQIDKSLEEAARIQGIGWFRRMVKIIVPIAAGGLLSGMLLSLISIMRELSLIVLLVTPSNNVLAGVIYNYQSQDMPQLVGVATTLLVALVIGINIVIRVLTRNVKVAAA
ncbi:ABC transporter permease [Microvirga alba]|uniref:Iron ABC transporter permease n=1 Tax=Microvirga alba TaxID=2791025 RepID=A0A931FS55_9HYPH|nr:iron ABC transporter permease [Microvirga alba]MBF9235253.1 iron ABC transporter permease [Microvirga alba]